MLEHAALVSRDSPMKVSFVKMSNTCWSKATTQSARGEHIDLQQKLSPTQDDGQQDMTPNPMEGYVY